MRFRARSRLAVVVGGAVLIGLVAIAVSIPLAAQFDQWGSDALLGLGTTIFLSIVLYFLTRLLDRHIAQVTKDAASQIKEQVRADIGEALEESSSASSSALRDLEQRMDRRVDDITRSVAERLAQERDRDGAAFAEVAETPSYEGVRDALERAHALKIFHPGRPPRVQVDDEKNLYLSAATDKNGIPLRIEDETGKPLDTFYWHDGVSVDDAMFHVARLLQSYSSSRDPNPTVLFSGLGDVLTAGLNFDYLRPIIQLCPPQWALTVRAMLPYHEWSEYAVTIEKLEQDPHFSNHVASKPWVDRDSFDAAERTLRALFGRHG